LINQSDVIKTRTQCGSKKGDFEMTKKTTKKWILGGLSTAAVGLALTGCGQNTANETAPAGTTTTQAAKDDHANAPPHEHDAQGGHVEAEHKHDHADDAADKAMIAGWFPGATVTKKPFPFDDDAASHLSADSGLKFSGHEADWGIYEAVKDGQRVGFAVMTHADIPGGEEMHVAFAVDKKFVITKTDIAKAPDEAKMTAFTAQFKGKKLADAWKVGKDLKATPGLPSATAQIAADTAKKGLAILDSNFNAAHGHEEAPHDESQPHSH